ncbi:unnamed protein product, partial [Porites evermanni]
GSANNNDDLLLRMKTTSSSTLVLDAFSGFPWINLGKVSDLR